MRVKEFIKGFTKSKSSDNKAIPDLIIKKYNKLRPDKTQKLLCLAPFNSIRFNRSGGVTPCCQNYNLDNIKKSSLKEVWFGNQFIKLRELIKKNDLSFFCDFCEVHLKNENYNSVLAATYDFHQVNINGFPSYIDFSIDNTCNLACIMCNSSLSSQKAEYKSIGSKKPFYYNESFFNELKEFIPHLRSVNFSGGEPFLINAYFKIWDIIFVVNPSLQITVTTNGTILNEKVKEYLLKGNFNINLSIDSLQKESYEKIRTNANFEKTLENIEYFKQYCNNKNTTFSIVVCPMRLNWKEIPDFVRYSNKNNIILNFNIVTKPFECAIWTMPSGEIATIYEYFKSFTFPATNETENNNNSKYISLISLLKTWLANAIISEKKIATANFIALRNNLKKIIKSKSNEFILSLTDDDNNIYDKNQLLQNIENVVANTPDMLLNTELIEKIKNLPVDFLFNEFYYQSVDTTIDNLCSLAYYSI